MGINLKPPLRNKKLLIIPGLVIVLATGSILAYFLIFNNKSRTEDNQKYVQLETDTAKLLGGGSYSQAASVNEKAYNETKNELNKARLAYEVGSAYASDRIFDKAKEWMNRSLEHYNNVTENSEEVEVAKGQINTQLEQIAIDESVVQTDQPTENPEGAL